MAGLETSFVVLSLLVAFSNALLNVSNTLGSNMVLQRAPFEANIWGWVDATANVTISFNGKVILAAFDAASADVKLWKAKLPATEAGGPYVIGVASSSGDKLALQNILFGDVYLCGGQSNMQFTVAQAFNASEEIALAAAYPNIRVLSVGDGHTSLTPLSNLGSLQLPWSVASPKVIGGGEWSYMSAVCWLFGKDLYDQLNIPIGLISSNWGGTIVQAWSSPEALAKCNSTEHLSADPDPNTHTVLWNAMIVPFLPQVIRGAIWYQGEANVGQDVLYACQFKAMISDWRAKFGTGYEFPFFFVQLAPWLGANDEASSVAVARLRTAQLNATALRSVAYASAVDLGDAASQYGSIHPRNKQTVGKRLAASALNVAYGRTEVVWEGPTLRSALLKVDNNAATIIVTFETHGEQGLHYRPAACPAGQNPVQCKNFELLLSDGKWYDASSATLSSSPNQVTVILAPLSSSLTVKAVRYAYSIWPLTTFFSAEGLPAIPFEYYFSS